MIVASLALLTERHGETSKQVKMPHQFSGKFFRKRENKNQNHQHSNLHHLYIAEILTKLRAIYDATVMRSITTRFRNGIASIYIQEAKERDAISDRRDTANATLRDRFPNQTATIYVQAGKKREVTGDSALADTSTAGRRDTAKAMLRDTPFLECSTGLYGTLRERFIHDAITQQPQSIYDATRWRSITPGFRNQTQKSRSIYDAMVWINIFIGDGIAPHPMLSMTERHRSVCFIYDGMS